MADLFKILKRFREEKNPDIQGKPVNGMPLTTHSNAVVRQNMGKIWGNLEIAHKFFSLLILVVLTLTLKNRSDDTLSLCHH